MHFCGNLYHILIFAVELILATAYRGTSKGINGNNANTYSTNSNSVISAGGNYGVPGNRVIKTGGQTIRTAYGTDAASSSSIPDFGGGNSIVRPTTFRGTNTLVHPSGYGTESSVVTKYGIGSNIITSGTGYGTQSGGYGVTTGGSGYGIISQPKCAYGKVTFEFIILCKSNNVF